MTVKQLKEALEKYPDNMDVFVAERKTEFTYGLVNSVYKKEIIFLEDESDLSNTEQKEIWEDEMPKVMCVVLDEE